MDEGVCSACRAYDAREEVDWDARKEEFRDLVQSGPGPYDCIVPVSGGKDSHAQVIQCLQLGLRPLAVNARTCHLSTLGRKNLDNIRNLCDLVEVAPNLNVRRRLNRLCLETVGDISWPEHVAIFTTPVRVAIDYEIPYIIWGECPQNEYGGPNPGNRVLNRDWLEEFGGLLGLRVSDLPFYPHELAPYQYPEVSGVIGIFMGYYFPWDGFQNAYVARKHGFKWSRTPVQASGFRYENLDNYQTGIHDFFKFLKFGFSRATDICSVHIRRGRMDREEGLRHVRVWDGNYPEAYLDADLYEILDPLGLEEKEFMEICEQFVNRSILTGPVDNLRTIESEVLVG
jgi:N-acetyl sugar amidotransferase